MKLFRPQACISVFGAALSTVIFQATPAVAIQDSTVALQHFALEAFNRIFPNHTYGWQDAFVDGTWHPDVVFTWNANPPLNGVDELWAFLSGFNTFLESRANVYRVDWTGVSAFATNENGTSGFATLVGNSTVRTLDGTEYTDGTLGAFGVYKWNEELGKTQITEWREATSQPNYPNYPWSG